MLQTIGLVINCYWTDQQPFFTSLEIKAWPQVSGPTGWLKPCLVSSEHFVSAPCARSKWIYEALSENLWCILVDFSGHLLLL